MDLGEFLKSINSTKENLIRTSHSIEAAEKAYPPFVVARSLSYAPDAILYVNELNRHGLASFGVSSLMHYEYLLYSLPKKNRFAKWIKPDKSEAVDLIMQVYRYSRDKAEEVVDLFDEEKLQALRDKLQKGGAQKGRRNASGKNK